MRAQRVRRVIRTRRVGAEGEDDMAPRCPSPANGWGTCARIVENPRNRAGGEGKRDTRIRPSTGMLAGHPE
ncbi:hypothetical protein GCM10025768_25230 [Microbacterium pseudoresistens]